ncbi:NACHT domain-containing protein [Streptomyces sp. NPDC056601]|uniref:NACHT domain-containing protein n=1 Tax=Streptomyces sp. NPDC056601 TaxID=3345875 RepID=UPI00367FC2F3
MVQSYDYEALGADSFQQLCQALLTRTHRNVQCFPVGMPDGGRDASVPSTEVADCLVYQVKFRKPTPNKLTTADDIVDWLIGHIKGELSKAANLAEKGASQYIVMTNAQWSSHEEVGTRDRVQNWLNDNISIPAQVWWRDDIDRRLDGEVEIKRTYGLLRDSSGLAELLGLIPPNTEHHEILRIARTDRRVSALLKYLRHQYERDRIVKFKQTELEPDLLDVFVDVPASGQSEYFYISPTFDPDSESSVALDMWEGLLTARTEATIAARRRAPGVPAAMLLLSDIAVTDRDRMNARLVLEGAPGQGKSTIAQYVCQVHRARLLGLSDEIKKFKPEHVASPNRLPFHVDLRDLSSWLRKEDPFDVRNTGEPAGWSGSLEAFLAAQVRHESGGMKFTVSDLDAITSATPILVMLDGLDEVPDLNDRKNVVTAVNDAVNRMEFSCPSLVTVVTSRPSAFAKTPGFSPKDYSYLSLGDLSLPLVLNYTDGWLRARNIPHQSAYSIRKALGEKLGQPHIVDLARNPMQLAILLWLVRRLGPSLPDKRTALYSEYMSTFLDREAEKSTIVRDERDLILELHGYVGWELHCQSETGQSRGRIPEMKLKALLRRYLSREGYKKPDLVDQLFTGITQRVMVLTSRVQGTFEFEVQPLREYFAARHLYLTARNSPPGRERRGSRPDRFEALLRNPYWWNVTRFYAGFSDKGELASLAELLEVLCEEDGFSVVSYPKEVSATLLRDQVFTQAPRSAARLFDRVTSNDSLALLLAANRRGDSDGVTFGEDGGDIETEMRKRIERSVANGQMDMTSCRVLARNSNLAITSAWWFERFKSARNDHQQRQWLTMSKPLQSLHFLQPFEMSAVAEAPAGDGPLFWKLVIADGIPFRPHPGTVAHERMLRCLHNDVIDELPNVRPRREAVSVLHHALSPSSLYRVARFHSAQRSIYQLLQRKAADGLDLAQPLDRLISRVLPLYSRPNARPDIKAWQAVYDALAEIFGHESRKAQVLALMGGELRCGTVSRALGGNLLDRSLPAVYRARYARQRRGDESWWREQVSQIGTPNDAWFVAMAMLLWASPEVFGKNAKSLDRWVKDFTADDMSPLIGFFARPHRSAPREPVTVRGLSHQMMVLVSLGQSEGPSSEEVGAAIRKAKSDRDLAALYAQLKVQTITWNGVSRFVSRMDEVREAMRIIRRGSLDAEFGFYADASMSENDARRLLHDPDNMISVALAQADRRALGALTARATPLADVAKAEGWFDADDYS